MQVPATPRTEKDRSQSKVKGKAPENTAQDAGYERKEEVVLRPSAELARAATAIESPYDTQARHSNKRALSWLGYKAHLSETCDPGLPRLVTHVHTTVATIQ